MKKKQFDRKLAQILLKGFVPRNVLFIWNKFLFSRLNENCH